MEIQESVKLSRCELKQIASAMVCQTIRCFDMFSLDETEISEDQKEYVLDEIGKIENKYDNEYSYIGGAGMIAKDILDKETK